MLKMISDCYHKFHKSIKTKSQSDTELLIPTLMALLIEQSNEIEILIQVNDELISFLI